ncbi:hypothetical protein [Fortiea sp. LEGE XX443]
MMTEAILNQQELTKKNIEQLLVQLTNAYQKTKSDRQEITTQFPPEDEEFSLLEEIELLTVNLRGYASQVQFTGQIANAVEAVEQLHAMRILNVPQVARFFFDSNDKYEQMKNYLRMLDYLRLLLLEYLHAEKQ